MDPQELQEKAKIYIQELKILEEEKKKGAMGFS